MAVAAAVIGLPWEGHFGRSEGSEGMHDVSWRESSVGVVVLSGRWVCEETGPFG